MFSPCTSFLSKTVVGFTEIGLSVAVPLLAENFINSGDETPVNHPWTWQTMVISMSVNLVVSDLFINRAFTIRTIFFNTLISANGYIVGGTVFALIKSHQAQKRWVELIEAACGDQTARSEANPLERAQEMLNRREVDVNKGCFSENGTLSVVEFAVEKSCLRVLEFLVENGADVDVKDARDKTPLYHAILKAIQTENKMNSMSSNDQYLPIFLDQTWITITLIEKGAQETEAVSEIIKQIKDPLFKEYLQRKFKERNLAS